MRGPGRSIFGWGSPQPYAFFSFIFRPMTDIGGKRPRDGATAPGVASSSPLNPPADSMMPDKSPLEYEREHVHEVYDAIAPHFSSTRYRPWPQVRDFVQGYVASVMEAHTAGEGKTGRPAPSVWLGDVGCGNGKNMCIPPTGGISPDAVFAVGCDRSIPLMRAAQLGAVRRKEITVTQVEEGGGEEAPREVEGEVKKDRKVKQVITKTTTVDIPEALLKGLEMVGSDGLETPFRSGLFDIVLSIAVIHHFSTPERRKDAVRELLRLVRPGTGRVLVYVWAKEQDKHRGEGCDVMIPWEMHRAFDSSSKTYQRYYHLFKQGELEELCREIDAEGVAAGPGGIRCSVERSYFDKENWCAVLSRPPP